METLSSSERLLELRKKGTSGHDGWLSENVDLVCGCHEKEKENSVVEIVRKGSENKTKKTAVL